MSTNAAPGALHGPGLTDVRDMVMAHVAFRRALDSGASLVSAVGDGDHKRAGVVADHLDLMLDMLVHHHEGEDLYLWPVLLQRVPKELAPLVHRMEAQHEAVHGMLDEAAALIPDW
ncbi:hemerythrin domain-containing protein [Streptomyces sp. NPDC050704]|uniref:hemerythrin domain-containing protein n=1 Tax=Streptomyces sp. NPDC050704 TaxID=3157219 RepID=UPI003420DACF